MEDVFFFTIALYGLSNITVQIPQEQPLRKSSLGESCNSMRWINRIQSSFSESFFPVFNGRYFLFHYSPLRASNVTLQIPQEQSQRKASWGESCNSVRWINRTQSNFSESFFPGLKKDIFFLNIALYGLPSIIFQIPQEQP